MSEAVDFLEALTLHMREEDRAILCIFPGDPGHAEPNSWKPRPWRKGQRIPLAYDENGYVSVSSFHRSPDGSYRRRQDCFSSGLALMIDDIGTSASSKIAHSTVKWLPPNAIVETSKDNFQWWYFLDKPEDDFGRFDALIRGFINGNLLGKDPGMAGVNRVGRIPGFRNGKEKHNGWTCKLTHLDDRRTKFSDLVDAFKITLLGRISQHVPLTSDVAKDRIRQFYPIAKFLDCHDMVKKSEFDPSGWVEIRCPWVEEHTGAIDNGAAIRKPEHENGWTGAFRCHHGACIDRGWRELTEWVDEQCRESNEDRNAEYARIVYEKMKCDLNPDAPESIRKHWSDLLEKFEGAQA